MGDNDTRTETDDRTDMESMEARQRRFEEDLVDAYDEDFEMELDDRRFDDSDDLLFSQERREARKQYFRELFRLQGELVKLQDWVVSTGHRLVVIFEGRDAAGKGGAIKRITQRLNPRVCRVAALPAPNNRERTQWYFQRYVAHLPAGGEIVLFDRSWYNRAGVERVMNFCTDEEYEEFFRSVPEFEKMLVRSGIQIVKYWFSITDHEQEVRFQSRIEDPLKQWKLARWISRAAAAGKPTRPRRKRCCCVRTFRRRRGGSCRPSTRSARLNCIHHLLQQVPYHEVPHAPIDLPPREHHEDYIRRPVPDNMIVPDTY